MWAQVGVCVVNLARLQSSEGAASDNEASLRPRGRIGERINKGSSGQTGTLGTLHQKRKWIKFEFPKKIPIGHELISKMLPENPKIKKIYRGKLLSVYIYTKKLFFTFYNIFSRNLKSSLHLIPITQKLCKMRKKLFFTQFFDQK